MYIIVGPLCPASLKRFVFYKAQSALIGQLTQDMWLAEHHKQRGELAKSKVK